MSLSMAKYLVNVQLRRIPRRRLKLKSYRTIRFVSSNTHATEIAARIVAATPQRLDGQKSVAGVQARVHVRAKVFERVDHSFIERISHHQRKHLVP